MHCTSEEDGKAPLQLVVYGEVDKQVGTRLVNLGTKEQIENGKTIFMGS